MGFRAALGAGPVDAPARLRGSRGFTLIEVLLALGICLLGALACFHLFAYGQIQLEKQGRRRQALELMQGEMEYWRARFALTGPGGIAPSEALPRRREIELGVANPMKATLEPQLGVKRRDKTLNYQQVRVAVIWGHAGEEDTLALESRFYAP